MKDLGAKAFSYGYASPVLMAATYNDDGTVNVMNLHEVARTNAGDLACCIGKPKKTHENIEKRKAFTLTLANEALMKEILYLPVYDDICLRQQSDVYLSAGYGQSGGIHLTVNGERDRFRRRVRSATADVLRTGRRTLFHACVGYPYRDHFRNHYRENISAIERMILMIVACR